MRRKLSTRMLIAYLASFASVIALLTLAAGGIVKHSFMETVEDALSREGREINRLISDGYLDPDKRNIAREQLRAVVRQFDGLAKVYFDDPSLGSVSFYDDVTGKKWVVSSELDFFKLAGKDRASIVEEEYFYDLLKGYTRMRTLSYACPIETAEDSEWTDKENGGVIVIHYDLSEYYKDLKHLYVDFILAAATALLIIIVITVIITGRVTRPIIHMNDVVNTIAHGTYDARMKVTGKDEIAELARSFNDMADKIGELEQTRREFVANVSHELRSPLTSMRGFLEAMEEGVIPPEEQKKYIGVVLDESKRMAVIVNDLLDLARIESGRYSMHRTVFDITELIGKTLLTFEERIRSAGIEVVTDVPLNTVLVDADSERIGQVLHNLIDNAIKFMPPENAKLTVQVRANRRKATVSIMDNGEGIPAEDLPKIFERFYKVEKAHTYYKGSGTGLGLAIVKRIIDQHDEEIYVKSEEGYTMFVFTLKRAWSILPRQSTEKQEV